MSKTYRPWRPRQTYLLPPSPEEWLREDHLAYFVLDVLEELDLRGIEGRYEAKDARGTRPYDPQMMAGLLLYGYCVGLTSSRRLEQATYEDVAVRVLVGENHPDHTRISEFRREHLKELSGLFVDVLRLCQESGLVKLGHVSLDGTKVKGNASKHRAMSHERMLKTEAELKREIRSLLEEAERVDTQEDARYGKDRRGDELPEELRRREDRVRRIREAKAQLEADAAEAGARRLAAKEQAAEERAEQTVGKSANRVKEQTKRVRGKAEKARERARLKAKEAGRPEPNLEARDVDELPSHQVPSNRHGSPKSKAQRNFTDPDSRIMKHQGSYVQGYNAQAVVDGEGQIIVAQGVTNQAADVEHLRPMLRQVEANCGKLPGKLSADSGYWSQANDAYCKELGVDAYIATGKQKHGEKPPPIRGRPPGSLDAKGRMYRKLRTKQGREVYARRKVQSEPVFGQIKLRQGAERFLLRGIDKVCGEFGLMCTAHNLLKLFGARRAPPLT